MPNPGVTVKANGVTVNKLPPAVRSSVKLARCAGYKDGPALMEHCISMMVQLTQDANAPAQRLDAIKWLMAYAQGAAQRNPKFRESDQQVIAELRMLYKKALPAREEPEAIEALVEPVLEESKS